MTSATLPCFGSTFLEQQDFCPTSNLTLCSVWLYREKISLTPAPTCSSFLATPSSKASQLLEHPFPFR